MKALKDCGVDVRLCHYDVTSYGERRWMVDDEVIADFGTGFCRKRFGNVSTTLLFLTMHATKESTLYICALFTMPVRSPSAGEVVETYRRKSGDGNSYLS